MEDDLDELSVFTNIIMMFCKNDYFGVHAPCIPIYTLAGETNRLLRMRNMFVYGMTSLLFDKLLKHKGQVSKVDESLFPAFHRVRTSTLGRFTKYMAESLCRSLYATCGITFVRSLDTPVFL